MTSPGFAPTRPALTVGLNPLASRIELRDGFPIAPGRFPLVGHAAAIARDELGLLRATERQLGPLFFLKLGENWQLFCLLREAFDLFRSKLADSRYLREGRMSALFGDGVIAHDGKPHQHMRGAMNPTFQPRGLGEAGVGAVIGDVIERRVRELASRRDVPLLATTRELTLEVMFRVVGIRDPDLSDWRRHYERLMLLALPVDLDFPGSPARAGRASRAWLDERIQKILRSGEDQGGLIGALTSAQDENGEPLTERELIDNLRLLLLAGHETSASTMAWCVAHLATKPEVWTRVREEALAAPGLPRSPKELRDFPYAEAVFRETLRLAPTVSRDARQAIVDFELAGRIVRAGTMIAIPILLLSRDPELYPEPDAFRPERWLGRAKEVSPLERVQFGGGAHFCLGYHLAWMEIVQFIVALGRALPAAGPRLAGGFPATRYVPLVHPSSSTRAHFRQ